MYGFFYIGFIYISLDNKGLADFTCLFPSNKFNRDDEK